MPLSSLELRLSVILRGRFSVRIDRCPDGAGPISPKLEWYHSRPRMGCACSIPASRIIASALEAVQPDNVNCIPLPISALAALKEPQLSKSDYIGQMWGKLQSLRHRGSNNRSSKDHDPQRRCVDPCPCVQCRSGVFHAKLEPKLHPPNSRMAACTQYFLNACLPAIGSICRVLAVTPRHPCEKTADQ